MALELLRLVQELRTWNTTALLERLLTQETSFFRYPACFRSAGEESSSGDAHEEVLGESACAAHLERRVFDGGRAVLASRSPCPRRWSLPKRGSIHILATDISRQALEHAERGVYTRRALETVDADSRSNNYFAQGRRSVHGEAALRNLVTFAPMNLAQAVYMGRFDVIFCMNVLIYFSEERRACS